MFLQNPRPDVQRVGGGGKTNISLLEHFEEEGWWGKMSLCMKNMQDKNLFNEKKRKTGYLKGTFRPKQCSKCVKSSLISFKMY